MVRPKRYTRKVRRGRGKNKVSRKVQRGGEGVGVNRLGRRFRIKIPRNENKGNDSDSESDEEVRKIPLENFNKPNIPIWTKLFAGPPEPGWKTRARERPGRKLSI